MKIPEPNNGAESPQLVLNQLLLVIVITWLGSLASGYWKRLVKNELNVDFKWFELFIIQPNAFSAKQIDAVTVTNGDNLVIGAGGIMLKLSYVATDYSAGNDAIS